MKATLRAGLKAALVLTLAGSAEWAQADNMCGTDAGSGPVSDLSLGYVARQPASPVVCAYANLAIKCGDHALAHEILDKCIAKGYAASMIMKGMLFEDGRGTKVDLAHAAALYRQAAATGEGHYAALGKLHYASALHEGKGVPKDEAEARRWFELAAKEGSEDAAEFLRTGHHTGSRDVRGQGVGMAGDWVRGIGLVKQAEAGPLPMPTPRQHTWTAGLLSLCLLLGAWRQQQGSAFRPVRRTRRA